MSYAMTQEEARERHDRLLSALPYWRARALRASSRAKSSLTRVLEIPVGEPSETPRRPLLRAIAHYNLCAEAVEDADSRLLGLARQASFYEVHR